MKASPFVRPQTHLIAEMHERPPGQESRRAEDGEHEPGRGVPLEYRQTQASHLKMSFQYLLKILFHCCSNCHQKNIYKLFPESPSRNSCCDRQRWTWASCPQELTVSRSSRSISCKHFQKNFYKKKNNSENLHLTTRSSWTHFDFFANDEAAKSAALTSTWSCESKLDRILWWMNFSSEIMQAMLPSILWWIMANWGKQFIVLNG